MVVGLVTDGDTDIWLSHPFDDTHAHTTVTDGTTSYLPGRNDLPVITGSPCMTSYL